MVLVDGTSEYKQSDKITNVSFSYCSPHNMDGYIIAFLLFYRLAQELKLMLQTTLMRSIDFHSKPQLQCFSKMAFWTTSLCLMSLSIALGLLLAPMWGTTRSWIRLWRLGLRHQALKPGQSSWLMSICGLNCIRTRMVTSIHLLIWQIQHHLSKMENNQASSNRLLGTPQNTGSQSHW